MVEQSETSDNQPYTTSDTSPETTPEEQTSNVELLYTRQHSEQSEQEDFTTFFQIPEPHQEHPHFIPHHHKFPIYNKLPLLKQLQPKIIQNSLKNLYKIHEVLQ